MNVKRQNTLFQTLNETDIKEFHNIKHIHQLERMNKNYFMIFGERRLHNGYIEGMNNHIKVIKRIYYGYNNFKYFRARIMYIIIQECISKKSLLL